MAISQFIWAGTGARKARQDEGGEGPCLREARTQEVQDADRGHGHRWGYRFFLGSLESIDREARQVVIAPILDDDGSQLIGRHRIRYDWLVLAIGAVSKDFGTPGVRQHCLFLDTRRQADRFRRKLPD